MRNAGRWRRASSLAGGGEMAIMSTLATTDDDDVTGSWCVVVQTVLGSRWSVMVPFGRISWSSCRLVALFALGNLTSTFALVSFSLWVCVLPVEYVVLDFSGRVRCLVQQWIHVLREALGEFQYFLRCGELES